MLNRFSGAPAPIHTQGLIDNASAILPSAPPEHFSVTRFARPGSRRQCSAVRPCALSGSPNLTLLSLPFATVSRSWTPRRALWHC